MAPIVFPFNHIGIYVFNILIVVSWFIFSFLFWRNLRRFAVEEDHVFDLTFYATIVALIAARIGYVATHWALFVGKSPLLIPALWVLPGLSWLEGMIGGLATLIVLCRQYKVRLGLVFDTLAVALPLPIIIGEASSLLAGLEVGKLTRLPWAVRFVGYTGLRHPVQLYEMIAVVCISGLIVNVSRIAERQKWAYGIIGIWFFMSYSLVMFGLEFVKDTRVYWGNVSANQWILIGIFAESIGVIYVRGGGREALRPKIHAVHSFIEKKGNILYAAISRRHLEKPS